MVATLRRVGRRLVPSGLRQRVRPGYQPWVITEQSPSTPVPLERTVIYALVGTWMEADIIADTVANAFTQGVDRVFLVDNASPDDTVARALAAGAEHVLTYRTEQFEEQFRYNLMNELVRYLSATSDHDHIWWIWLDADEFPRPQSGGTLREFIEPLDRRYRVIGARVLNHYPTPGASGHTAGRHPIDSQPMCEELIDANCEQGHRKHPLQRWDRTGPRIDAGLGFHRAECVFRPLIEPLEPVIVHHLPFRNEDITRRRLELLWSGGASGSRAKREDAATDHMRARMESLDAVYAGEYAKVHNFMNGEMGVKLVNWTEIRPPLSHDVRRWAAQPSEPADG